MGKNFINYFEQQDDWNFNVDDLKIFRKYLHLIRIKQVNLKRQGTLDTFLGK